MRFCKAERPTGLISPSAGGGCTSVPWVPPSHSLDVKSPHSSLGEAPPCEELSGAGAKGHCLAGGGRQDLLISPKHSGFGVPLVALVKMPN